MSRKRDRRHDNPGRPSNGLTERRVVVHAPELLARMMDELAAAQGVSSGEEWRRAARVRLGLDEVPGEAQRQNDATAIK